MEIGILNFGINGDASSFYRTMDAVDDRARKTQDLLNGLKVDLNNKNPYSPTNPNDSPEKIISRSNGELTKHGNMLEYIARRAIAYIAIWKSADLAKYLIEITGEFQKNKVALESMLQNKPAADELFDTIKKFSTISPFQFKDLFGEAKQLTAYSIPAKDLFDTLKRIGDVASGTGSDMSRLVLAYGEVNTQTILNGRVLRQFTQAGVPLVSALEQEFTKLTGKATNAGEVFDKISKKEVTFKMVKDAIKSMTDEGGIFYNLQLKQSETLAGKWSNLKDKFDIMFSSFGNEHNGFLSGTIDAVSAMAQHWKATLEVIKSIVVAWGAYKTTLMITNALKRQELATEIEISAVAQRANTMASWGTGIGAGLAVLSLIMGAVNAYNADKKQSMDELFNTVAQTDKETEANNKLIDRLKELTRTSKDDANAELERNNIIEKLSQTEPELSYEIDKHRNSLENLKKVQDQYNATQDIKKSMTLYINDETNGPSVKKNIEERTKAQLELERSTIALKDAYSKLSTAVVEYKEHGIKTGDISSLNQDMIDKLYKIINLSITAEEKMRMIDQLNGNKVRMGDSSYGAGSGKIADTGLYDEYAFSKYRAALEDVKIKSKEAELSVYGLYRMTQFEINEKKIKLNTSEGKAAIKNILDSYKDLDDKSRKYLYFKFGIKWGDEEDPKDKLTGWRKELQDFLGTNVITIKIDDNLDDVMKNIRTTYKELKEDMSNEKPILLNFGINPSGTKEQKQSQIAKLPATQWGIAQAATDDYNDNQQKMDKLTEAHKKYGIALQEAKENKAKTNIEDKYTKNLMEELKYIKSIREEYDKLTKSMSESAAQSKLKSMGLLTGRMTVKLLPSGDDDSGFADYLRSSRDKLQKRINTLSSKTYNKLYIKQNRDEIIKELADTNITSITKAIEDKMKDIESELSQYKSEYNMYKQLLNITGDKESSMKAAFGNNIAKDLIDYTKEEINKALSESGQEKNIDANKLLGLSNAELDKLNLPDSIKTMLSDLKNTIFEQKQTSTIDIANLLTQYESVQEKIDTINRKANVLRSEASKLGLDKTQFDKFNKALQQSVDKQITDIETASLQLTPFYQKLFGDISSLAFSSLDKLLKESKKVIADIGKPENQIKDNNGNVTGYKYTTKDANGKEQTTVVSAEQYARIIKQTGVLGKEAEKINPIKGFTDGLEKLGKKGQALDGIKGIGQSLQDVGSTTSTVASGFGNMFAALGNDKASATANLVGGIASGIGQLGTSLASGNPVSMVAGSLTAVVGIVGNIAAAHDAKLDRAIEKSKQKVKELQNEYTDLERDIKRQLGSATSDQYSKLFNNYKSQLAELKSQLSDEEDKKKSSASAIADYKEQIADLQDKITYFSEDFAKDTFSIDIKDWASQISNSLVDAFSKGEDAATAFGNTVASIMQSVIKNIIAVSVIQPAMEKLRTYLFGENGVLTDGNLTTSELNGMLTELKSLKGSISSAQNMWNKINEYASQNGIDLTSTESGMGITASEQSLTENTGNVLASYINSIRADGATRNLKLDLMLIQLQSHGTTFGLMLSQLKNINDNTAAIAENTKDISDLYILTKQSMTEGSGTKQNVR